MKTKQCHHFIVLIGLLIGCLLPAKVSASPSVLATGPCGDNLTYTIYDDMSMVITGTGPMWDYVAEDTHPNQDYYSDVKSVTIEEGCTYVGKYAFDLMGSLTDVTIPGSVIEIGTGAFSYCRQLSSLELSAGLKIIGGGAFECCGRQDSGLKSITIPSTVTTIGGAAFTSCYLNSITVESSSPLTIQANTFASTDVNSCTLYVPTGSKSAYQSADVWKDFSNIVEYEGASPSVLATGPCGDNVSWSFDTNTGELTISGTGPMWDYDWDRPLMDDEYNGSITSVTVEEGVTSIGDYAFYENTNLTSITIPNSVTRIGSHAFLGTTWYNNQTDGLVYINNVAYKYKGTMPKGTSIAIRNGTVSISEYAFYECTGLTSVTIPNSVTSIGEHAFYECTGLTSVTIPNSVTSIGEYAFCFCYALTSVTIPNGVTSIERDAFFYCLSLTSVTIPNGVTSIGYEAFCFCYALTSVTIPNGVTSIGENAFSSCTGLTTISVDAGNSIFDSRNDCNAIIETSTNELILGCKNTVIPNSVTSIGDNAFSGCEGLTSVTIPNSVTSIGSYAFDECIGLTSLTIPNSVTSIGENAFYRCYALTSISCKNETPVTITNSVFSGVDKSTCTLYVPTGSKSAYQSAAVWSEFTNIEELTLNVDGIYYNISPSTMTASVTKKPSLGYYSGDITIPETVSLDDKTYRVTEIEELAFYDCKSLTSVTIPNGVTSIGYQAFYNCTRLTSIDIPSSVTSIGRGAFSNCTGLTSVTIPNGVTSIEPETFNMCNSLASVIIPNGVTSIGNMAFCRCFALTSVTIPNGVTSIGYEAFLYCTGLTSVTIPNSLTSISNEAFSNCTSLTSFTCENETPVTITNSVFSGVNKSTCTLNVPTGSKSAYQSAAVWSEFTNIVEFTPVVVTGQCGDNVSWSFDTNTGVLTISGTGPMWDYDWTRPLMDDEYNGSITSVTVEEGVTSIGDYAFYENPNLTSITIPNSVTRIGSGTFCECTGLTSFTIPNSVTIIDNDAFLGTTWYNNQPDGLVYILNSAKTNVISEKLYL